MVLTYSYVVGMFTQFNIQPFYIIHISMYLPTYITISLFIDISNCQPFSHPAQIVAIFILSWTKLSNIFQICIQFTFIFKVHFKSFYLFIKLVNRWFEEQSFDLKCTIFDINEKFSCSSIKHPISPLCNCIFSFLNLLKHCSR